MLFLWIEPQNDSGYRFADRNTVGIKRWVCHISSTVMVVR